MTLTFWCKNNFFTQHCGWWWPWMTFQSRLQCCLQNEQNYTFLIALFRTELENRNYDVFSCLPISNLTFSKQNMRLNVDTLNILFCLAIPNFIFSFLLFILANGCRQLQNSNGSSIRWEGIIQVYLPPNFLLPFPPFQEWKTHIVSFLANCSTNSRFLADCDQGIWVLKKYVLNGGCCTFSVWKMCQLEKR